MSCDSVPSPPMFTTDNSSAAAAAGDQVSVVNMGGEGAESQETRATEASVRGFWKAYRRYMGI